MEEEDFIDCPKFNNSIKQLIEKNPEGIDDETIAKILNMSVEEVEQTYQNAIKKLQKYLEV
jgi:DNA-directed RNA polymerase specialized sigma24 family protein